MARFLILRDEFATDLFHHGSAYLDLEITAQRYSRCDR